jgi:hypothetical protein
VNGAERLETAKKAAAARVRASQYTRAQLEALAKAADDQGKALLGEQKDIATELADQARAVSQQCLGLTDLVGSLGMDCDSLSHRYFNAKGPCVDLSQASSDPNALVTNIENHTNWSLPTGTWSEIRNQEAACMQARASLDQARGRSEQNQVMQDVQRSDATAAADAVEAAKGTSIGALMDGKAALQNAAADLDAAVADLARSVATIDNDRQAARLAVARQQLESSLAAQGATLSLDMYRQYDQYDWWRARALLDGARRYAVAARRAIEAGYVTSLDSLTAPEPFVAAPSSWADDVYKYDLSMPSAVGLSAGAASPDAVYPNQILDYVGNLERFVQGFAVQRPMSAATDSDVITLPGPGATLVVDGQVVADPAASKWSALCPAGSGCTSPSAPDWCPVNPGTPISQTCAPAANGSTRPGAAALPSRIRNMFFLDPWAQIVGAGPVQHFEKRVNVRWGKFAVNLVGSGITDCSQARDPNTCQASQFLRYDLQHLGPSLAQGATREWMLLDIPLAQVESGKAATLGQFVDVERNGWGKPFIEAIARAEFEGRPMNGNYAIELAGDEGTNFDAIQSVQILAGISYWVLQQ